VSHNRDDQRDWPERKKETKMNTTTETMPQEKALEKSKFYLGFWRQVASDPNFGVEYCKAAALAAQQFSEIVTLLEIES
jgi:hypothetical protein